MILQRLQRAKQCYSFMEVNRFAQKDVLEMFKKGNGQFLDIGNASCDLHDIERAIQYARENQVDFLIGAGGANIYNGFSQSHCIWKLS